MTDNLVILAIGCVVVVGATHRVRRDVTGPTLTALSQATSWVSLGTFILWLAADWLSGSTDQWFTTIAGALPLAIIQFACLSLMTVDTLRGWRRRRRAGRRRRPH